MVVLRRQIRNDLALSQPDPAAPKQLSLGLAEIVDHGVLYEYAVLVTSLDEGGGDDRPALPRPGGRGEQL